MRMESRGNLRRELVQDQPGKRSNHVDALDNLSQTSVVTADERGYEEKIAEFERQFENGTVAFERDELLESEEDSAEIDEEPAGLHDDTRHREVSGHEKQKETRTARDSIWSEQELSYLRSFARTGLHFSQIDLPGRSEQAVYRKLLALGLYRGKSRWTSAQTDSLVSQYKKRTELLDIRVPGKDHAAVYSKACALGLHKPSVDVFRKWTEKETAILNAYLRRGVTPGQIFEASVLPGRSPNAILTKAAKINHAVQEKAGRTVNRERYTDEERTLIRKLVQLDLSPLEMKAKGHFANRTVASVQRLIEVMRLVDPKRSEARLSAQPWTHEEVALLRQAFAENGRSQAGVARLGLFPGRTKAAVLRKIGQLNLLLPDAPKRSAKRLDGSERERYEEFLRKNAETMTIEDIAAHWGRSVSTVDGDIARVGIRLPRRFAPEKLEHVKAVAREFHRKRCEGLREQRKIQLLKLRGQLDSEGSKLPQRNCKDCLERWYLTRDFFQQRHNKRHGSTQPFFTHRCVLCRRQGRIEMSASSATQG